MKKKMLMITSFLLLFLLSFRFFFQTEGIVGHNWDWVFPSMNVFSDKLNILSIFTWNTYNLGGVADLTLVHLFPTSLFVLIGKMLGIKTLLFLLFLFVVFASFISFKKLLDFLLGQSFLNYIPAFLYGYSPFLFNDIIGGAWVMWVSYAFCPIYFVFFIKYLKISGIKYLLPSLLISIIILLSFQNFVLINLLIQLYLIYEIIVVKNEEYKKIFKKLFIFSILEILINVYWILPFSYTLTNFTRSIILLDGGTHAFDSIKNSTQSIWNILNLGGYHDRNMYLYALPPVLKFLFQLTVGLAWLVILRFLVLEKNRVIIQKVIFWTLSLLVLIIIVKGGNNPFSRFTLWLYYSFPLMKLFRSHLHLMLIPVFIIPILIAFSLNYFYKNLRYKKTVLAVFVFLITVWISGWWYNGDLGHKTLLTQKRDHIDFYQLPPELIKYYEESQKDKIDYRSFFLPSVQAPKFLKTEYQNKANGNQPEYFYLNKPTFTSEGNKFADNLEISFCQETGFDYIRYLSLFSVKNIILRSDIYPVFTESSKCWNNDKAKEILDSSPALEKYLEGKYATAYRIKDAIFLPHFYIPEKIINSNGGIESLADIVDFEDYQIRSAIYLEPEKKEKTSLLKAEDNSDKEVLDRTNEVFVKAKLENGVDKDYFDRFEAFKNETPFPYASWEPGSLFYPLVLKKEQFEEWQVRNDSEKLIDRKLYFAGKRIAELEKWEEEKDIGYLIRSAYEKKMEEAREQTEKLNDSVSFNITPEIKKKAVIKLRAYWERHKEEVGKLKNLDIEELKNWENVFEELNGEIKIMEKPFDLRNLEYSLEIPKKGVYSMLVGNVGGLTGLEIGGNILEINRDTIETNGEWVKLGEREIEEGKHQLVLHLPELENLVGTNWQKLEEVGIGGEGIEFSFQTFFPDTKNLVFQEINNWQPNNLYYLSFDYKTEEGGLGLGILESKIGSQEENKVVIKEKLLDKSLGSGEDNEWKKFETVLKSSMDAMEAEIFFYGSAGLNSSGKVEFKNLKIQKIIQPKVILRETNLQALNIIPQTRKITFVKINPTKYRVKVEGAVDPFTLVFSESFHQGWKAWITENTEEFTEGTEKIIASYFDGEIKEWTHKNVFLDKNTFETWGKKPISEDKHLFVNGYANSWYFTPQDSGGRENYEIIIEFWPQRLFYIGLGISLTVLLGCLGYLGYRFTRRKKGDSK